MWVEHPWITATLATAIVSIITIGPIYYYTRNPVAPVVIKKNGGKRPLGREERTPQAIDPTAERDSNLPPSQKEREALQPSEKSTTTQWPFALLGILLLLALIFIAGSRKNPTTK